MKVIDNITHRLVLVFIGIFTIVVGLVAPNFMSDLLSKTDFR